MKILIAGDLVPTKSNDIMFKNGLTNYLSDEFKKKWFDSDYRIFNLECPITEPIEPILKNGPHLSCDVECLNGIINLKPSLVLLSNNHILDYGHSGLKSTINLLKNNNIAYTGIIDNCNDVNKGYILEKDDIKVGIYNICDTEFSCATTDDMGASCLSIKKNYLEIKELKSKCDHLIVIYHGGKEYYQYPSPELKDLCEYFVEIGTDIVICQHSHCIGCKGEYKNGTIIYGQGNFIFDDENSNPLEEKSLIIDIEFTREKYNVNYIPIEKSNSLVSISKDNNVIESFNERSNHILDSSFINKQFNEFSSTFLNNYFSIFSKRTLFKKIVNKFLIKQFYIKNYSKEDLVKILNFIDCSAHREVLVTAIKSYLKRHTGNKL